MAPSSALPVGAARAVSEMQPVRVRPGSPGSGLLNAVLAVLALPNPDENERYDEEILDLTVTSFIYMWVDPFEGYMGAEKLIYVCSTQIDARQKKMTILSPNQSSVVGRTAIVGSFEYQDL